MRRGNHRAPSRGHSKVLIVLLAVGMFVALGAPAGAVSPGPVTLDFESLTGPSVFSTADAPVSLSGMTISGGQILTAATNMPANQTTIYGTSDFCSGCERTVLVEFDNPVDGLAFDLLNGWVEVAYAVITPYGIQIHTLPSNLESGMVRVVIPERKVLSVRIRPRDETPEWDFFVDNFTFEPRGAGSDKPLYENYKWYNLSPLASAEKVEWLSLSKFIGEADSPDHDPRLNWTTDECSGPSVISVWSDEFANPCRRHDFGYRNFGSDKALDKTADRKSEIDAVFFSDMTKVCKHYHGLLRASCFVDRNVFYNAVHFTPWGHNAFFG